MTEAITSSGPCAGIKVIDCATMVAGALAGQMLGDQGAEVIKIEPLGGEMMRHIHPQHLGMSATFLQMNRSKRSLQVDLKSPKGVRIVRDLIAEADVFLENARPGVFDRLGLGYDTLRDINPRLVYASVTGFGPTGPYAAQPAYDNLLQGITGVMSLQNYGADPQPIYNAIADKITAISAASAIVSALLFRERNGQQGQRVSVSMLDAFGSFILADQLTNHTFLAPGAETIPHLVLYRPVATLDGFVIGHIGPDHHFAAACKIFNRTDLLTDPRFAGPWLRASNYRLMWQEFEVSTKSIRTAELLDAAQAHGVPLAKVNSLDEFFEDPQVQHNGTCFQYDDPEYGAIRQLKYPANFEVSPVDVQSRAPKLGEHTDAILAGLNFSPEVIAEYRAAGVVA